MTDDTLDLQDFLSAMPPGLGSIDLSSLIDAHPDAVSGLHGFDPLRLAATFAGLLTVPELQSNCIRIESLVHLSLASGHGKRKPSERLIGRLFTEFGKGPLRFQEDPAEDVFVSLVRTPRGNFRVLGGVWESAGFYLQRTLAALERVPSKPRFDHIRDVIYSLLQLSEAVCERADLARYVLGNVDPEETILPKVLSSLSSLRRRIRFKTSDLAELGISASHLAEFGFDLSTRTVLRAEAMGTSSLERYPVALRDGEYCLLLPTAVSVAIRRYVLEEMHVYGLRDVFASTIAYEYAQLFAETPLLGARSGAPLEFKKTDDALLAGAMATADHGLYINFVLFADTLEGFEDDGMMGVYPAGEPANLGALIERWIDEAYNQAVRQPNFRECLTVLVGCGIGRAIRIYAPTKKRDNWRYEFIGAPDLLTMSWLKDFKPISLWRLLDSLEKLESLGVSLQNVNGPLNLIGWARSLGGHLVPHGDMPDSFAEIDARKFVMVQQNSIREVRHEVLADWDAHVAQDVDGRWINVRKDGRPLFEEDRKQPFFMAEDPHPDLRWPRGVFETSKRAWWFELHTTPETNGHYAFQRAMMLKTWLCRMVPALEAVLPGLPEGPVLWRVACNGTLGDIEGQARWEFLSYEAGLASISCSLEARHIVKVTIDPEFEKTLYHPENIAERALVARSVEGFAKLAGATLSCDGLNNLVQEIVQGASARQSHAFIARYFRDYVRDSIWNQPVEIDADDSAWLKLGLGWRKRSIDQGGDIRGRQECTAYLNDIVRELEDEVCNDLRSFDRCSALMFALHNHESAIKDRDNWRRTAAAVLALHKDKDATLAAMAKHDFTLNGVFHASRLLIEFALCECPLEGGREPGRLDMSRLMAKVLAISGLGGWSAAIHWEAMEPRLRITPLGDIHANVSFQEEVLAPYSRASSDFQIMEAALNYADNLVEPVAKPTDDDVFPTEFWAALEEEMGGSLDAARKFFDTLEHLGIERKRATFRIKNAELLKIAREAEGIGDEAAVQLCNFLTFNSRPCWRDVPAPYDERDRFPWRFRRRLTILRKPLIKLNEGDDSELIIAPGIARDAFVYMVGNYHRGDFPLWQLKPKMRRWAGRSRDRIGREFSESVASRLRELGWQAETEVAVTKLLRKGIHERFGDLKLYGDVDVLAWRRTDRRVLLLECKDVQYRKIEGEIAEQLRDFRGEVRDGKPDLLLRHLRRHELVKEHFSEVAAYVGIEGQPRVEAHLVFRNPVPMKYAWRRMESRLALHLFSELERI